MKFLITILALFTVNVNAAGNAAAAPAASAPETYRSLTVRSQFASRVVTHVVSREAKTLETMAGDKPKKKRRRLKPADFIFLDDQLKLFMSSKDKEIDCPENFVEFRLATVAGERVATVCRSPVSKQVNQAKQTELVDKLLRALAVY